jgi:uncharacterized membrane protein YesL
MSTKAANLLYKPFGLVGGIIGGAIATAAVNKIWTAVARDNEGPPKVRAAGERWAKVVAGAALQGAVFAAVKTGIDRAGARQFERWTGTYPASK